MQTEFQMVQHWPVSSLGRIYRITVYCIFLCQILGVTEHFVNFHTTTTTHLSVYKTNVTKLSKKLHASFKGLIVSGKILDLEIC